MLMIWSSRARNRSFDPIVLCFFGRIVPLRCTTESWSAAKGNPQMKIARFGGLKPPIPAISNAAASEKQILAQSLRGLFTGDCLLETYPFGVGRRVIV